MEGGVHGKNEQKVVAELCAVIDDWVKQSERDKEELPPGMAGRKYSGKFNLRLNKTLHERLAIEAVKEGESLNAYCA
jgi:predicted HicB family RNase H-like nuclease